MATTTAYDYPKNVTPGEVWALLREIAERQKETDHLMKENAERQKEADRRQKEADRRQKEADRRQKELDRLQKETARQMKETDKRIGYLSNRFGEVAEHLVAPGIHARFNELGYHFGEVAPGGLKIIGEDGKTKAEIDLLLQNDDTVMAVEVKAKPAIEDIEGHIKRLEILRDWRRKKNDNRKIQGAIAGAVFGAAQKKATAEAGLYVIGQSGDTMKIDLPDGFIPREW